MEVKSILLDKRIQSYNVLGEMPVSEYVSFAYHIIDKNEFQRRRVIKAKVREILKEDLKKGCLIPSLVLATYGRTVEKTSFEDIPQQYVNLINTAIENKDILIIDGLQRTYVILALAEELKSNNQIDELAKFLNQTIRVEIYIGLKRIGLLYRMITLNTGQTTMSTRHLMEILYHDYAGVDLGNVKLISDKDEQTVKNDTNEYSFKDILDGFNSFIERDEGIINRTEILDNIKSLEVLKDEVPTEKDIFKDFVFCFKHFLDTLIDRSNGWSLNNEYFESASIEIKSNPFGTNILEIFKTSQALTGFGAASGQLKELKGLTFDEITKCINQIKTSSDWEYALTVMLVHIDIINNKSKKIGNDQRYYFRNFFRALFNKEGDQFLDFSKAANYASNRTREERL